MLTSFDLLLTARASVSLIKGALPKVVSILVVSRLFWWIFAVLSACPIVCELAVLKVPHTVLICFFMKSHTVPVFGCLHSNCQVSG